MRTTVDAALIMSLNPCNCWPEDRVREAVPEEITIVDFLRAEHIPPKDRLWVVVHPDFCSHSFIRRFACNCADRALTREREAGREPDERSWAAVDVARRYALWEATDDDLCAARAAAWHACDAAADAWSAAWSAAWCADADARSAAWCAAADAWCAAWSAAGAARAAAWCAAWSAADAAGAADSAAARDAAWNAAWSDEGTWQCIHLAQMLEEMK